MGSDLYRIDTFAPCICRAEQEPTLLGCAARTQAKLLEPVPKPGYKAHISTTP